MEQSREGHLEDLFQKFTQDFGLYSIGKILPSMLGIVALMLFTRVFPPAAYGRYALTMTFVSLFGTLSFNWIQQSVTRFEPQFDDDELVGNVISIFITSGILIGGVTVIGYPILKQSLGQYQPFYFAAVALIVSQGAFQTFNALFRIRLQSSSATKYNLFLGVTKLAFAVILAVFVLDSIVGWIWGHALALFLAAGFMARELDLVRFSPRLQSALLSRFVRYGFPMIGWVLGMTLLQFADRVLLEFFRGPSAVGVYSSNYSLVQRGLFLALTPIGQAAQPLIMNAWDGTNKERIRDLMTNFTRYFLIVGVPATIFAAIMGRPLSTLLLADQYHDAYLIIPIVAPGLFLWNSALIGHTGFEIEERTRVMFFGVCGAVVLNILLNIPLINMYGYLGAAVATLISFSSYAVFAYVASRWSIRWQVPTRTLRNTVVGGIAMGAPATWLYLSGSYTLFGVFGAAGVGIVLYLLVLYGLNEFRESEVSTVAGILRGSK